MAEQALTRPQDILEDKERALDWLTALLPALLISLFYYRWQAFLLELLAVGGYLMAARLLAPTRALSGRLAPAVVTGLLAAFCLPATTPYWPAALAGAVAAVAATLPGVLHRCWSKSPVSRPLLQPALVGYLFVRLVFPSTVDAFTVPVQWNSVDGLTSATPLAAFSGERLLLTPQHLLFGIHAGAIGETCTAVLLLGAAYLLLRRRLRLIAPVCMLATVSLLSWWLWNSPLYAVLAGGGVLAALLLADRAFAPASPLDQTIVGVVAGVVTVLLRRFAGMDGTAVGVLAACILQPTLPYVYGLCRRIRRLLWPLCRRAWQWLRPRLRRLGQWVQDRFSRLWQIICEKISKKKK